MNQKEADALAARLGVIVIFVCALFVALAVLRGDGTHAQFIADETSSVQDNSPDASNASARFGRTSDSSHSSFLDNPPAQSHSASADASSASPGDAGPNHARRAADIALLIQNEQDAAVRARLIEQLGEVDDVAAIAHLLNLLELETDPEARMEILRALRFAPARLESVDELLMALEPTYESTDRSEERVAVQSVFAEIETPESADFLRTRFDSPDTLPEERIHAAESLLRLNTRQGSLVDGAEAERLNEWLKLEFQAAGDSPVLRSRALMGLAERRSDNDEFFRQALSRESDPNVQRLLEGLIRMGKQRLSSVPNANHSAGI